jgi:hypothetical protein
VYFSWMNSYVAFFSILICDVLNVMDLRDNYFLGDRCGARVRKQQSSRSQPAASICASFDFVGLSVIFLKYFFVLSNRLVVSRCRKDEELETMSR